MISVLFSVIIWIALGVAIVSKETQKRRYIAWLMVGIATFGLGVDMAIDSHQIIAIFDFIVGLFDFWLSYFWYKKYKETKLSKREKFLNEIMKTRK